MWFVFQLNKWTSEQARGRKNERHAASRISLKLPAHNENQTNYARSLCFFFFAVCSFRNCIAFEHCARQLRKFQLSFRGEIPHRIRMYDGNCGTSWSVMYWIGRFFDDIVFCIPSWNRIGTKYANKPERLFIDRFNKNDTKRESAWRELETRTMKA